MLFIIINPVTSQVNTALPRAYTQQDLDILVGNVQRPNGISWFNDKLYTVCSGDWTLYDIDASSGATRTYLSGVRDAHSVHTEADGEDNFTLWIPDFDSNQLYKVDGRSVQMTAVSSDLGGPWGIDRFDEDNLLVSNLRTNSVSKINENGLTETILTDLRSPTGIASDSDYVYIANNGSARRAIEWSDKSTLSNDGLQLLLKGVQNTGDLVLAEDGYLYFTYALGTRGVVGRVNPEECRDEACSNEDVEIVVFTELPAPLAGLTVSDDMELFFHAIYRPEIYSIDLYNPQ
ncbi:MAG: hypothetical protein ACPG7F_08145 [Aggregatilineales bacterium]